MTEKSVTDHGISVVAQKDCAVWRGLTAGELCREWQDPVVHWWRIIGNGSTAPAIITAGFAAGPLDLQPLDANLDDGQSRSDGMMKFRPMLPR